VFFLACVKDSQQRLPFASCGTEFEMIDGGSRQQFLGPALQVLDRYILEVLAKVLSAVRGFLEGF
jgi:hypothetical protein